MKICRDCGCNNSDHAKACRDCGARLIASKPKSTSQSSSDDRPWLLIEGKSNRETGPFTYAQLKRRYAANEIGGNTLCYPKTIVGATGWRPLRSYFPDFEKGHRSKHRDFNRTDCFPRFCTAAEYWTNTRSLLVCFPGLSVSVLPRFHQGSWSRRFRRLIHRCYFSYPCARFNPSRAPAVASPRRRINIFHREGRPRMPRCLPSHCHDRTSRFVCCPRRR